VLNDLDKTRKREKVQVETHGRVEISFPAAATPMTVETPQPLWHASSADRITSTLKRKRPDCQNEKNNSCLVVDATYVARGVKREVEPTICELDEVVLNTFALR
jgi:hypothetical protein